jgi:hypothetical protein
MNEQKPSQASENKISAKKPFEAPQMEKLDIALTEASPTIIQFIPDGSTPYTS